MNTGVPAMARIISARDSGTMVNNQPRLVLEVEITPGDGGSPYRFETRKVVSHSALAAVRPGATLPVSVDPRRPERFAFIDAEQYASRRLERLAALHASGMLSDDEFATEKQRILGE